MSTLAEIGRRSVGRWLDGPLLLAGVVLLGMSAVPESSRADTSTIYRSSRYDGATSRTVRQQTLRVEECRDRCLNDRSCLAWTSRLQRMTRGEARLCYLYHSRVPSSRRIDYCCVSGEIPERLYGARPAQPPSQIFTNPKINGVPVDACDSAPSGSSCDSHHVFDRLCQERGFPRRGSHSTVEATREITWYVLTRTTCNTGRCIKIKAFECLR